MPALFPRMVDGLLYRFITQGRLKLFRRPTMKTVLGAFGKCRRNYSLPTLEVAGSNPASAANYGRVAQRIERVKISLLLVARCTTPYGRMPAGLQIGYCGFDSRRRKRRKSYQSSRPPFFAVWRTNALGTTFVAGSSPAPFSAGSSVG